MPSGAVDTRRTDRLSIHLQVITFFEYKNSQSPLFISLSSGIFDISFLFLWTVPIAWMFLSNSFSIKMGLLKRLSKYTSSNINEVIKAVLNSLFFLRKDFAHTKSTKSTKRHKYTRAKAQNANKRISDYFPLRCFLGAFFIFVRL